jgi:betaine-aldehyde dehydrogenase
MSTRTASVARHWIDGKWADSDEHRDSVNPATGEVIGSYAMGGPKEAQAAIEAAKRAFADPAWRTSRLLRARVLNRMADRFEQRADDLVELLGLENGKTQDQGRLEVAFAPETLRFNAALALTDTGTNSEVTAGELSLVVRQPVGWRGSSPRGTRRSRWGSGRWLPRWRPAARR